VIVEQSVGARTTFLPSPLEIPGRYQRALKVVLFGLDAFLEANRCSPQSRPVGGLNLGEIDVATDTVVHVRFERIQDPPEQTERLVRERIARTAQALMKSPGRPRRKLHG